MCKFVITSFCGHLRKWFITVLLFMIWSIECPLSRECSFAGQSRVSCVPCLLNSRWLCVLWHDTWRMVRPGLTAHCHRSQDDGLVTSVSPSLDCHWILKTGRCYFYPSKYYGTRHRRSLTPGVGDCAEAAEGEGLDVWASYPPPPWSWPRTSSSVCRKRRSLQWGWG